MTLFGWVWRGICWLFGKTQEPVMYLGPWCQECLDDRDDLVLVEECEDHAPANRRR